MSANLAGLATALGNFNDSVKGAIDKNQQLTFAEMEKLMNQLTAQFNAEALAQGNSDAVLRKAITEKYLDIAAANIDCAAANHFGKVITAATTLTVSNPAATGKVTTFVLHLTNAGTLVTFWSGIKWSGGTKPTLSATGRDILAFSTKDGGLTWDGFLIGQDMK